MSDPPDILEQAEMFEPPPPSDRDLADLPYNDYGNGQRLIARHGRDLVHLGHKVNGWRVWAGTHWIGDDSDDLAKIRAHETAKAITAEARALEDDPPDISGAADEKKAAKTLADHANRVEAHFKFAVSSGNDGKAAAMLASARPYLLCPGSNLDADPLLFNTPNGTLDLDSLDAGARPHDRNDRITRIAGAAYDPEADAPGWRRFLDEILPDKAVQAFWQRWFGYCLSGLTGEQFMVVAWGGGANGKSTAIRAPTRVIGSYARALAIESLLHNDRKRGGDATPDLAQLPGVRLVTASEPETGARLSESVVKTATGGETMTARPLFEKPFEFDPTFKLMFSCNSRPTIRGQDHGIWRRMLMVPFTVTIPEERTIKGMSDKLVENEGPGILNWILDGWRLYRESGLAVPPAVRDATDEYRVESDPVGQFVAACVLRLSGGNINATDLYHCYQVWCRGSAVDPVNQNLFGRLMSERGYRREKTGVVHYVDIKLAPLGEELLDAHSKYQETPAAHPS